MEVLKTSEARQTFNELDDCTVVALATVIGISYEEAHDALAFQGRKNRDGASVKMLAEAVMSFGFELVEITQQDEDASILLGEAVSDFSHSSNAFLVLVDDHVVGINDGMVNFTALIGELDKKVSLVLRVITPAELADIDNLENLF